MGSSRNLLPLNELRLRHWPFNRLPFLRSRGDRLNRLLFMKNRGDRLNKLPSLQLSSSSLPPSVLSSGPETSTRSSLKFPARSWRSTASGSKPWKLNSSSFYDNQF